MNLATKTKYVNIVIRVKGYVPNINKLQEWCTINCDTYSFIIHDNDIQPSTGEIEPIHAHLVLILMKSQRLSTTLNSITNYLGLSSTHGVEIDKTSSFEGSIQYLLHKNDLQKTQHNIDEIITNISKDELNTILNTTAVSLNFDYIYRVCCDCDTLLDVIKTIGFSKYHLYRTSIQDIYSQVQKMKIGVNYVK